MRGFVLTIASISVLAMGMSSSASGMSEQTRVRILDTTPLKLRGVGFMSNEKVRLKVQLGDRIAIRNLRAGAAGGFTESFREMRYGRCGPALTVKAVGARGSRVSWELTPLQCPDRADS